MSGCDIPFLHSCLERKSKDKTVVCQALGKSYKGLNPNALEVCKYKLDSEACQPFSQNEKKCDFLLVVDQSALFIELKGGDINHAAAQILDTEDKLREPLQGKSLFARIIGSHVPKKPGRDYARLLQKFGERFVCRSTLFQENLDTLTRC